MKRFVNKYIINQNQFDYIFNTEGFINLIKNVFPQLKDE